MTTDISEFVLRYQEDLIYKKKIAALTNYSASCDHFQEKTAIEYIKKWTEYDFLDREEQKFLDYVLQKHNIDYTQWCFKTPWVREQIACKRKSQITFFESPRMSATQLTLDHFPYMSTHQKLERLKNKQMWLF